MNGDTTADRAGAIAAREVSKAQALSKVIQLAGRTGLGLAGERERLMRRIAVVTPVLDDWGAFAELVRRIARTLASEADWIEIVAVDDGSADSFDPSSISLPEGQHIDAFRILHLALNLGHQRAIAVGLVTLSGRKDLDSVIVMDSDGEDRPEDLPLLLAACRASPDRVIFAHRARRRESAAFKAGYFVYKFLFRALTGRTISFGNFSLLPIAAVRRLTHMPELWNNLPAAIIRSRLRFETVSTERGTRYIGQSKMNVTSLILHGLSAMSVYTDHIFVRVLLAAGAVSTLSLFAIMAVLAVRFGTDLAIPGWATTVFGDLVIILFQAVLMIVATGLMVLAGRSNRPTVPITDASMFIQNISELVMAPPISLYGAKTE